MRCSDTAFSSSEKNQIINESPYDSGFSMERWKNNIFSHLCSAATTIIALLKSIRMRNDLRLFFENEFRLQASTTLRYESQFAIEEEIGNSVYCFLFHLRLWAWSVLSSLSMLTRFVTCNRNRFLDSIDAAQRADLWGKANNLGGICSGAKRLQSGLFISHHVFTLLFTCRATGRFVDFLNFSISKPMGECLQFVVLFCSAIVLLDEDVESLSISDWNSSKTSAYPNYQKKLHSHI